MDWFNCQNEDLPIEREPLRVSEVSEIIGGLLDNPLLQDISVRGEVTNYTHHNRGHRYFTLSERGADHSPAVIRCVMWRSDAERLSFSPAEGMEVVVSGTVRTYAPQGSYQLQIKRMRKAGLGEKFLLIEQWKRQLSSEGCFSLERKRPLPPFPSRVGVVTSETGAVIHDIRTVIGRRFPLELVISPTAVQGDLAHRQISEAITRLEDMVDVIIVARGGGSFEDLFPFNHPDVVRAIVQSPVPVVSAIGHEVDVTLSDLAADLRAPTPSAAAELIVPDRMVLIGQLQELSTLLVDALCRKSDIAHAELDLLRERLRPLRFFRSLEERKQYIADLSDRLERTYTHHMERERLLLGGMKTALDSRNPLGILARGYCVAETGGRVVRSTEGITSGDRIRIRLSDGNIRSVVEQVDHERNI